MRVENQTADPVEYEQNGSPPPSEEGEVVIGAKGTLEPRGWAVFSPGGLAPYRVRFTAPPQATDPKKLALVEVGSADATIVLTSFPVVV
jgi:hypothetical protein